MYVRLLNYNRTFDLQYNNADCSISFIEIVRPYEDAKAGQENFRDQENFPSFFQIKINLKILIRDGKTERASSKWPIVPVERARNKFQNSTDSLRQCGIFEATIRRELKKSHT